MMKQVNFYLIAAQKETARLAFACRLAAKIYKLGHAIQIYNENETEAQIFDHLLWSEEASSFIPHQMVQEAHSEAVPIIIAFTNKLGASRDTLINLAAEIPEKAIEFQRIVEIITQDNDVLQKSRERYRYYQSQGYEIIIHDLKNQEKTHG